ncbi:MULTISPECIES: GtrA family protein [unclassified Marinimicrobium]|jgi:putative flippase GtrA|uniref:GtrA family protein n=1 Tax=unclassified Marinimicrobium TaxID=2632100 RepID=UPI000C36F318|nr:MULTISPECIES: GtrA family protein [unclassified Marinimicrobium]MAN50853.1 hypothetical protein [Marinimicrobium sp.]|tara:strand:+ start:649 stop:1053 length:405 start_codon:yes stop_codon:yes gene_type:complete
MTIRLLRQLVCFGIVGVAATLTHYLMALSSHEGLGLNLYAANLLGYVTAMTVSFYGHGWLTFRVALTRATLQRFVVASVSTFLSSEILLWALETGTSLPHRITLSIVVISVPVVSFILNKFWVYRPGSAASRSD